MSKMRILSGLFLAGSAAVLSGCVSDTYDRLTNTSCSSSGITVACGRAPATNSNSSGPTTTTTTGTTTTTATTVNTGNTNNFTTGDTTIIMEGSTVKSLVGSKPGLSRLADSPLNHVTANQTANTSIDFNTNTSSNSAWPVTKPMAYDDYGTCYDNHGPDPANPGKCMDGNGGTELGGNYKLYRAYQKNVYDEELQVWTWNDSYATQYRDVTASGTDPQHQAWSFGGNYTPAASLPTSGAVNYTGKFTATAKSSNLIEGDRPTQWSPNQVSISQGRTLTRNGNWRVTGNSALTANFGTGVFTGTLTPKDWQAADALGIFETVDVDTVKANNAACYTGTGACDPSTLSGAALYTQWQNYSGTYMDTNVYLNGTITKDATNITKQNQIVGTATLDPNRGWATTDTVNPMYGGFFGSNAKEVTGAFAVDGMSPSPVDGAYAINDDRRGYLQMSGIFHGSAP